MATQIETLRHASQEATAAYSAEMAKYGEDNLPTEAQAAHIDELRGTMVTAAKTLRDAETFLRNKQDAQVTEASATNSRPRPTDGTPQARQSLGERIVGSAQYKELIAEVAPHGSVLGGSKFSSKPIPFGNFNDLRPNASLITGTSSTSGGAFVLNDRYGVTTEYGRAPLRIRDIITNLTTTSDNVEYVRENAPTNSAAVVAEATDSSGSTGAKPESTMQWEVLTTPVVTIAHWMAASRQSLSDASQLIGLINEFLLWGLEDEVEDYIFNAATYGILNASGTQAQAWDTDVLRTTRVAKRKVSTVGRRTPTHFVLNPEDWETIELKRDNSNRFYGNGPFGVTPPTLWGLPVVESEKVAVGTGLVGDFRACAVWDREQGSVTTTNSHLDFFTRNLVAILAELRIAFAVLKPSAIVEIDLTA